eukprot:m.19791 g.19791  ORF g.19791 m.19791 type:complete len:167 (-) comp10959_c0_seq1:400-900(-)
MAVEPNPAAPYDYCVVGGGLWGSSCCHSLLELLPASAVVAFIAPLEPQSINTPTDNDNHWKWEDSHTGVYSAHYDEGRITRELDSSEAWSRLASCSIQRYRELERASGVSFYTESGYLCLGTQDEDAYLRKVDAVGKTCRCEYTSLASSSPLFIACKQAATLVCLT